MPQIFETIAIWAVPVLFAITLHEAAHGWVASMLGDQTARRMGRITMNPLRHIDPFGTVILPLMMLFTFGIAFGAAKPVPVDPRNFKQPQLDMALVALAGPASNFVMACFWAAMITLSLYVVKDKQIAVLMFKLGQAGVAVNVLLMSLNLLPIPPLDGGKVVAGIMPPTMAASFSKLERYGIIILVVLIALELTTSMRIFSTMIFMLVKPFMIILETIFRFQGIYF